MMDAFVALLEAREPARGCFRSYRVEAGTDLFGDWLVEVTFGRIGSGGRRVRYPVDGEAGARRCVADKLRRRATAPRRIGAAYEVRELHDPARWLPEAASAPTPRSF